MTCLALFYEFFKTGLFSVGGGLATLPFLMQMADRYPWFTRAELADMIAVSESTPGPIGVNMATFAGFSAAGVWGSLAATCALVLPSIIIVLIVARFLKKFEQNRFVRAGFYGVRPAVTGLIAAACFEVMKLSLFYADALLAGDPANGFNLKAIVLFAAVWFFYKKIALHPAVYLAAAAAAGVLFKF